MVNSLSKCLIASALLIWLFTFTYLWIAFLPEVGDRENWHETSDYIKTKEIHAYHAKGEFVSMELNGKWWFERGKEICWIRRR